MGHWNRQLMYLSIRVPAVEALVKPLPFGEAGVMTGVELVGPIDSSQAFLDGSGVSLGEMETAVTVGRRPVVFDAPVPPAAADDMGDSCAQGGLLG